MRAATDKQLQEFRDELRANTLANSKRERVDPDMDIDQDDLECDEEFDEEDVSSEHGQEPMDEDDGVDLKVYFDHYGLNNFQQIAVCRTYANHLAAKLPKRGPARKAPVVPRSLKRSKSSVNWKRPY